MPNAKRKKYTAAERRRYDAAYNRLQDIAGAAEPDAGEFQRALKEALASGYLIDWPDGGWALLLCAADHLPAVRAGLLQILIDAGADVNAQTHDGKTPLGRACWWYVRDGKPEYLTAIDVLLVAGAQKGCEENWRNWTCTTWPKPDQRARRDWLKAYINIWPERHARDRAADAAPAFDYAL